jgi:S-formylglutathione hydrolase
MGGHGALTIALREQNEWVSVSAFAPICNPTKVPWGKKAFEAYLGSIESGKGHDATCLLKEKSAFDEILIDQGTADEFLEKQLSTDTLSESAKQVGQNVTINMREGFDHSYHFIAAFIEDHVAFHGKKLKAKIGKAA